MVCWGDLINSPRDFNRARGKASATSRFGKREDGGFSGPVDDDCRYRWLEDESSEVLAWVAAQQVKTEQILSCLPQSDTLRTQLNEYLGGRREGQVKEVGSRRFQRVREETSERWSLWVRDEHTASSRILVDPKQISPDAPPKLGAFFPSPDGKKVAYQLSRGGRTVYSLHIVDVESSEPLSDEISSDLNPVGRLWHSRNRVAWTPGGDGIYYSRGCKDRGAEGARYHQKIYLHPLGSDPLADEVVFGSELSKEQTPIPYLSDDGRFLVITVHDYSGEMPRSEVHFRDAQRPELGFQSLLEESIGVLETSVVGNQIYFKTNRSGDSWKIIRGSLDRFSEGAHDFEDLWVSGQGQIGKWGATDNFLIVENTEPGGRSLEIIDLHKGGTESLALPPLSSTSWMSVDQSTSRVTFSISSPCLAPEIRSFDLSSLECSVIAHRGPANICDQFETTQVWIDSFDGTKVPMHLTHRKGISPDGMNPTVLHGYGGFGVSLVPKYRPEVMPFLERGGVYAVAQVRGGRELGEAWHRAGVREKKQNSIEDFIAAAEWLISEGFTSADKLGSFGWSNGGLLVSAAALQRPDLWGAMVAGSPVTDLARFHLAHGGRHWISEYGSPESKEDLAYLLRYSPYHIVPREFNAPATLIISPGADDRVAPWHARKLLARLLDSSISDEPLLLLGDENVGHSGGSALSKMIDRHTAVWSFFFWQLGVAELETEV